MSGSSSSRLAEKVPAARATAITAIAIAAFRNEASAMYERAARIAPAIRPSWASGGASGAGRTALVGVTELDLGVDGHNGAFRRGDEDMVA